MSSDLQFHRRSIRLKNYDYSSFGYYFVTICAFNRDHTFGKIVDGSIFLSTIGKIVHQNWLEIPNHYPKVILDNFIVMPNHMHGIIQICNVNVGVDYNQPLHRHKPRRHTFQHPIPNSIAYVIGTYKSSVKRYFTRQNVDLIVWQRNYYDHIIRDDNDLNRIRRYIDENTQNWYRDRNNPEGLFM